MTGLPADADAIVAQARAQGLPIGNILHHKLAADGTVLPGWRQYVANMAAWWLKWNRLPS